MTNATATSVPQGTEITITRPDNMHMHLRDDACMASTVALVAQCYRRGIVMPNLKPALTTSLAAWGYFEKIRRAVHDLGLDFSPLMTLYLTEQTPVSEIIAVADSHWIHAIKAYPANGTTNAASGIADFGNLKGQLNVMAEYDIPLSIHCEVADPRLDVFKRERKFIAEVLPKIVDENPKLRIIVEHASTKETVRFVESCGDTIAATITPQHLLYTRNDMLGKGIRPHLYCYPILQEEEDRQALLTAAASGSKKFFLGSDMAPHPQSTKESACGNGGCFVDHAPGLYLQAFEEVGALGKFEAFASHNGADFYKLPRNKGTTRFVKEAWQVPPNYEFGADVAIPINAGEMVQWKVKMD